MRVFWIVIGLLVLGALWVLLRGGGDRDAADRAAVVVRESDLRGSSHDAPALIEEETPAPVEEDDAAELVQELLASADARMDGALPGEASAPATAVRPDEDASQADAGETPALPVAPLRGSGTRDDPYRVPWDLLVTASETYRPRTGMTDIPPAVQALDGTWVRITGYLSFPLAVAIVDEALVMLNQWDGCCIGVPPSPYDGVELRLREPFEVRQRHIVPYGTIDGRFSVDPYLVNNWLVGLYLVEEATIDTGF